MSQHGLKYIYCEYPFFGAIFGSYWGHFWFRFTSRPARAIQFSRLSHHGLSYMSMEWLLFWTIWSRFISRPARALKFSRLSQHGLKHRSMKCPLFGTMSGPCFDQETLFCLALLPDQHELIWSKEHVCSVSSFLDNVRVMFGTCLHYFQTS